jgi:hypothetical protein
MKRSIFSASFLLVLSLTGPAQTEMKPSMDSILLQRQDAYDIYTDARVTIDSTAVEVMDFAQKTDPLIIIDDMIIGEFLPAQRDWVEELRGKLTTAEKENSDNKAALETAGLYLLITAGAALLMFILCLVFLILFILRGGKVKKVKKLWAENDILLAGQKEKIASFEKTLADQAEQFKKDIETTKSASEQFKKELDTTKTAAEQERKNFRFKEEEFNRKVTEIEDKFKKSGEKEADLNYQVSQIESRLKSELEATVTEKCQLENKVSELERELSEIKMALAQEKNHPPMNEEERNYLLGKISWLENEAPSLRQWAENEKQAKEHAENALHNKNNEVEGLYRERDDLWGRIHYLEGQLNEANNRVNDLQWLQNEKNQLLEQLKQAGQNDELIKNLNERIGGLEKQINELRPKADEAGRLKEQLDEMIRFVDKFRSGN